MANVLGVDLDAYNAATAQTEAGGRNLGYHNLARSTASGLYGITDTTWQGLMRNYPNEGFTMANKSDPAMETRGKNLLTQESATGLQRAGLPVNQPNLAMVSFLGPAAAHAVLAAPDGADAYGLLQSAVGKSTADQMVRSNPELLRSGQTAGGLRAMTQQHYGGGGATPQAPQATQQATMQGPAAGAIPAAAAAPQDFSWVPPPSPSAAAPQDFDPTAYLALMAPTHQAVRVNYDPWAVAPKL